jgi:hypothetical protein
MEVVIEKEMLERKVASRPTATNKGSDVIIPLRRVSLLKQMPSSSED